MTVFTTVIVLLTAAALWQVFQIGRCLRRRHRWRATRHTGSALVCIAPLAVITLVGANLYTWHRFTAEQAVATIAIEQLDGNHYQLTLTRAATGTTGRYTLRGDDWRLETRVLRWGSAGTLLGFDTRYRLERLAGRYRDIDAARSQPVSVHNLTAREGIAPVAGDWLLTHLPLADSRYGSATYLPLADGARYRVTIGRDGLIPRPMNTAAKEAVAARF